MESDRSIAESLHRAPLIISSIEIIKNKNYRISLECVVEGKTFTWVVQKNFYELQNLFLGLKRDFIENEAELPEMVSHLSFKKLPQDDQVAQLSAQFSFVVSHYPFSISKRLLEFLEISLYSFSGDQKCTEGSVRKIGSGRRSNQSNFTKYFLCCKTEHTK